MTLSVVVPTLGRPSLATALDSVAPQLLDGDEIVVCADEDGDTSRAARQAALVGARFLTCPHSEVGVGCAQRNAAIEAASGTHLVFLDDDDVFTPEALALFREHAHPERPVIFRMRYGAGNVLWHDREVRFCNVGTPMFCVPNLPGRVARWRPHVGNQGADYAFIADTVELLGQPVWNEAVVAEVKPNPSATC